MHDLVRTLWDELIGLRRYKWPALLVVWLVCIAGWSVVYFLPSYYEAKARLFVDTRSSLATVIQDLAIQQDVATYLNFALESLRGEDQLEYIIAETGMASRSASRAEIAQIKQTLRSHISIEIEPVGQTSQFSQPTGMVYTIRYRDRDRERSQEVITLLLDAFVEGTLGGKKASGETAREFLTTEIMETEQRLREAEQRLADFKKSNVGMMPGVEGDYFTRLQTEIDLGQKARTDLSIAIARRNELAQKLSGELPFSAGSGSNGSGSGEGGRVADTQTQLAEAERKLRGLLLRYTEKHPEVQGLKTEIAALEERRRNELRAIRAGDPDALVASGATANPVYQSIQVALNDADVQIAALRRQVSQHDTKIAELRELMNSVPEVEAELARLNRDYEVTRAQYTALVDRLKKAELGQDAEATSSVRFDVIDPPSASSKPIWPRRPLLVVVVLMGGIAAGLGLAFLLSKLRPVFVTSRQLYEATGLPVLGEVTLTYIDEHAKRMRRSYALFGAGAFGLLIAFGAVLVFNMTHVFV